MSGGAFDYKCHDIAEFARELKRKLDRDEGRHDFGADTELALDAAQKVIAASGEIAHDIEWFFSGDIGPVELAATFRKEFDKIASAVSLT